MESKSSIKLWIAVVGIMVVLCFQTFNSCEKGGRLGTKDTVVYMGKPIVNNYHFTQPTLVKESTVIYDSTRPTLTKVDTDLIVKDYLKRRQYVDSIVNDTNRMYYTATVEKNALKDIQIRSSYKPKIIQITEIKYKRSFFFGLGPAVTNNSLSFGANMSYAWQQYQVGTVLDPFKKNYYFYASKRIGFK